MIYYEEREFPNNRRTVFVVFKYVMIATVYINIQGKYLTKTRKQSWVFFF